MNPLTQNYIETKKRTFANFLVLGLLLLGLFLPNRLASQEVIPTYSDYLTDNLYLLHPSMAGASNMNKIRLTARQQWFDVENAPSLQTASIHARVGEKIGVGGIAFNDRNGNFSRKGAYATFAYHLLFSRSELDLNQLSFGISGGLIQHSLDQSGFTEYDPLVESGSVTDYYGNMDVGISYYYYNFFTHFTAQNLLVLDRELYFSDAVPSNQRKYLLSSGYTLEQWRSSWAFEPSFLFQWREQTREKTIDLNAKVYKGLEQGSLFGGLSYRRSFDAADVTIEGERVVYHQLQYLTPFAGFEYRNFMFAYTYSQQFNSVVLSNQGFHQITLGFNFGESRERYDCWCPGVNQRWK